MSTQVEDLVLLRVDEECANLQAEGHYLEALDYMERSLVLRRCLYGNESEEAIQACKLVVDTCNGLATAYLTQDNFQMAMELIKKAEALSEPYEFLRAVTYNNLACYYRRQNKLRTALKYLEKALQLNTASADAVNRASTHLNLCAVLSQLGRHAVARGVDGQAAGQRGAVVQQPQRRALQEDPRALAHPAEKVVAGLGHELLEPPVRATAEDAPAEEEPEARAPEQRQRRAELLPRRGGGRGDGGVRREDEREEGDLAGDVEELVRVDHVVRHHEHGRVRRDGRQGEPRGHGEGVHGERIADGHLHGGEEQEGARRRVAGVELVSLRVLLQ